MPTSLGPAEILVVLVVALIVLGPNRLPEAGRQVGKALAEVRHWSRTIHSEMDGLINTDPAPVSQAVRPGSSSAGHLGPTNGSVPAPAPGPPAPPDPAVGEADTP